MNDMSVATLSDNPSNPKRVKQPKPITWEAFEKRDLGREDTWKYEWVNGLVEKTKRPKRELS